MTARLKGVRHTARLAVVSVCMLFTPAPAKADAGLDWNAIAVSTDAGGVLGRDVATYVYKHTLRRLNDPE